MGCILDPIVSVLTVSGVKREEVAAALKAARLLLPPGSLFAGRRDPGGSEHEGEETAEGSRPHTRGVGDDPWRSWASRAGVGGAGHHASVTGRDGEQAGMRCTEALAREGRGVRNPAGRAWNGCPDRGGRNLPVSTGCPAVECTGGVSSEVDPFAGVRFE